MAGERRVVGVDESGKGDFFGPLVIAAFLSSDADLEKLAALGVRDGKLIANKRLLAIDEALRREYPHQVLVIEPETYNRRYADIRNLNKLLADGHASVIDGVLQTNEADLAISDKFGKAELIERELGRRRQHVELSQLVRGEQIPQVAAASILARAEFLRQMNKLSDLCGMELPRGAAAQVDAAGRLVVDKHGPEFLLKLAKTHFKNYHRVVNPTLFKS